jgi:acetolactate synthase-1/2/3 large subunit
VKYRLPVVFVVMNDQDYGAIRYLQSRLYGRTGEHALAGPDFLALARAFGAEAQRADDADALRAAVDKALSHPGPTVIEVPLAIEPPWDL